MRVVPHTMAVIVVAVVAVTVVVVAVVAVAAISLLLGRQACAGGGDRNPHHVIVRAVL